MKIIFLDRDGVINKEVGYLHKIADFDFIDGIFTACQYFQKLGFKIIIITNQSGIARHYYDESDFHRVTRWMTEQFEQQNITILDIFFCPHGPKSSCDCRKPKPGMFLQAVAKYPIDLTKSWMIGDKEADIQAANSAGIFNTILTRSGHKIDAKNSKARFIIDSISRAQTIIS
jgi:D-glycero-D-manno-heptose 1,7-bisphosphate phosphatase